MLRRPSPPNPRKLPAHFRIEDPIRILVLSGVSRAKDLSSVLIYTLKIRNRRKPRRITNLHFSNLYKSRAFSGASCGSLPLSRLRRCNVFTHRRKMSRRQTPSFSTSSGGDNCLLRTTAALCLMRPNPFAVIKIHSGTDWNASCQLLVSRQTYDLPDSGWHHRSARVPVPLDRPSGDQEREIASFFSLRSPQIQFSRLLHLLRRLAKHLRMPHHVWLWFRPARRLGLRALLLHLQGEMECEGL